MWLDLTMIGSAVVSGFVCGRISCAIGAFAGERKPDFPAPEDAPDPLGPETVVAVAERLKEHAETMAASVDEHQTKMQAVNHSLNKQRKVSSEQVIEVVNELIDANRAMQGRLKDAQDRIHEQSLKLESAEQRAYTDSLTRLANRGAFDRYIAEQHAQGPTGVATLAMLDIDHFKKFNDHHGHLAGDEVLRVVANLLHCRLNQHGLVARYGGEEFAVVFAGVPAAEVKRLVELAREAIAQRETMFENKCLRVTVSIGIAQWSGKETAEEWIRRADAGLYQSKEAGRNCSHWMENTIPHRIGQENATNAIRPLNAPIPTRPSVLDSIANQQELSEAFRAFQCKMDPHLPLYVTAVRSHVGSDASVMDRLLPVSRATLRTVDKIGYADVDTLLICMPGVSEADAKSRGTQICRSAVAMGIEAREGLGLPVTVGIAKAAAGEVFDSVVSRAIGFADAAKHNDNGAVCVADTPIAMS